MPVFMIVALSVVLGASIAFLPFKVFSAIALFCLAGFAVSMLVVRALLK